MIIGVPKEIKVQEHRVGMVPAGVVSLTQRGHKILIQEHAGEGAGYAGGIMSAALDGLRSAEHILAAGIVQEYS